MTAFIARNATESIGFIKTQADKALTEWAVGLSKEYISIPTHVYELPYVYIFPDSINSEGG
jgi:leucyl aminopeptidase